MKFLKKTFKRFIKHKQSLNDSRITLFFVNNKTGEVMFKLIVDADCNQNFGFIDKVEFTEM